MISDDEVDKSSVYFLTSSKSIFIGKLIMCAALYIPTKILHFLFFLSTKIFDKSLILAMINKWFSKNTKWWTLIVAFIESNMIIMGYQCFRQLRPNSVSSFIFENKLNFILTYFIMFLFLTYALCFYFFTYRYINRSSAQTLLNYSRF